MYKNLSKMKPMERHRHLTQNTKVCPSCQKEKKLNCFYNKDDIKISRKCNRCKKKDYESEVRKIVLSILTKSDL